MTPEHFRQIREAADLSRSQLATILRIKEVKTIYRYEHGERAISGPVSSLVLALDRGWLTVEQLLELGEIEVGQ